MTLSRIMFHAAFAACLVSPATVLADPQDPILNGVYVLSQSADCEGGGTTHDTGTIRFNPKDGSMDQHIISVSEGVVNGKQKLVFTKTQLPDGHYTLAKARLTLDSVPYRVVFGAFSNGIATYAS